MHQEYGVAAGRVCPRCGQENAIPVRAGRPTAEDEAAAGRGLVVLSGCVVTEEVDFACRSCALQWGAVHDPTVDEQRLADALDVRWADVVASLGLGWRIAVTGDPRGEWFVSGDPAQLAVGVEVAFLTLAEPRCVRGSDRFVSLAEDGQRLFSRDDLLVLPDLVAEAAEGIAARRRRSFRWCRTCRQVQPPEWISGRRGVCGDCADRPELTR